MLRNYCNFAPRVVIISGNHLCHNPRVIKESISLVNDGIDVIVLGMWFDNSLKKRDQSILRDLPFRFTPVLDLIISGQMAKINPLICRFQFKCADLLYKIVGIGTRWQLGYGIHALQHGAMNLDADLYIAHSEAGMQVAVDLLRDGARVGVDMEDWFSEDLLPEARRSRPLILLRNLERLLLCKGSYSSCPSRAMSETLANEFVCSSPKVVYNAFPWSDRQKIDGRFNDRKDRYTPSIHWYSQCLGHGRGLEDLLSSLPYLTRSVEVHLRGKPVAGFDGWLRKVVPEGFRDRIFVHTLVPNNELLSRIAEHDIGFAGEMKYSRSRDLTVTNKILHYLLAGLAVVASDTAGQTEIAEESSGAVSLYPAGDPLALAAKLNELLESPDRLNNSKAVALEAAQKKFCWERQENVLLGSVRNALGQRPNCDR